MRHRTASRKGISPIVVTIVLVAITIILGISVAYWMGALSSLYTRVEKVEIFGTSISNDFTSGNYTITFNLKNSGSADATVDMIYLNGKPYDDESFTDSLYVRESDSAWVASGPLSVLLRTGSSASIIVRIDPAGIVTVAPFTSGTTLDIKIHTVSGKVYPQMVILT